MSTREIAGVFGFNEIGVWCTAGGGHNVTHRLYAAHRTYPDNWPWQRRIRWRGYWKIGKMWSLRDRIDMMRDDRCYQARARWNDDIRYKWHPKNSSRVYARRIDA